LLFFSPFFAVGVVVGARKSEIVTALGIGWDCRTGHLASTIPTIAYDWISFGNRWATQTLSMLGDSITEQVDWHELFPGRANSHRGIAGDTSAGVVNRLDEVIRPASESSSSS